tara:strand:- start:3245 stop:4534 length:1290 start_codon:yes stop_codon:yes gene_type:complete
MKKFQFERFYIYLIIVLALILNWVVAGSYSFGKVNLNLNLLPKKAIIIIDILQALFLTYLILKYPKNRFLINTIVFLVFLAGFSFLINSLFGYSITIWISGIRHYFSFTPILLIGYLMACHGYSIEKEFRLLLYILFIQIPITIVQFIIVPSQIDVYGASKYDVVSGTMGGFASNLLSLVLCIGVIYYFIRFLELKKVKYFIAGFLLIIPPILASAKGMILVLIVISLYLIKSFKLNVKNSVVILFVTFSIVGGFSIIYNSVFESLEVKQDIRFESLLEYAQSESGRGRLSRIESINYAGKLILKNDSPLFGMGLGSANSNPIGENSPYDDPFTIRHSLDILITETGVIGVILIIVFLYKIYTLSKSVRRKLPIAEKFNRNMATLVGGLVLVFSVSLVWTDVLFRIQFMYPFGLLIGYVIGLNKRLRIK